MTFLVVVSGDPKQARALLYSYATVDEAASEPFQHLPWGKTGLVVELDEYGTERAQYQIDRLLSGWHRSYRHATLDSAVRDLYCIMYANDNS